MGWIMYSDILLSLNGKLWTHKTIFQPRSLQPLIGGAERAGIQVYWLTVIKSVGKLSSFFFFLFLFSFFTSTSCIPSTLSKCDSCGKGKGEVPTNHTDSLRQLRCTTEYKKVQESTRGHCLFQAANGIVVYRTWQQCRLHQVHSQNSNHGCPAKCQSVRVLTLRALR